MNGSTDGHRAAPVTPAPAPAPAPVRAASGAVPGRREPVQIRPGTAAARASAASRTAGAAAPRGRVTRILAFVGLAIGVAAVVVVLVLITGGSGGSATVSVRTTPTSNAPGAQPTTPAHARTVDPTSVTVAVLNGTPQGGVAHAISARLTTAGYKPGKVANATDQTRTATIVGYLPGNRAAALAVADSLKVGAGAVQPVDPATQLIVCANLAPAACPATVIVTVGTDLQTQ